MSESIKTVMRENAATMRPGDAFAINDPFVTTGLVGPAREFGGEAPKMLARAFARMAWPAYVLLLATGIWNVTAAHYASQGSAWKAVLMAKIVVVIMAGIAVYLHQRATGKAQLALWGSVGGLASVAALVMGILLAG